MKLILNILMNMKHINCTVYTVDKLKKIAFQQIRSFNNRVPIPQFYGTHCIRN